MEIIINKNDILNTLSNIQGITSRKSSLTITETVLIETVSGHSGTDNSSGIALTATDLETGFKGFYPALIKSEGVAVLNARKFYEIVRDFPVDEISINKTENNWLKIGLPMDNQSDTHTQVHTQTDPPATARHERAGIQNIQYHISGMNPDDFPECDKIDNVDFFKIGSVVFKTMIDKMVIPGSSVDDKQAYTNGVYFEKITDKSKNIIRMVSTDGNRLSIIDYFYNKDFEIPSGSDMIVPKKGLIEVSKFLTPPSTARHERAGNDSAIDVEIGFKGSYFVVKKDNETFIIRLLEGDFPEYKDIIAIRDKAYAVNINKQLFLMMLKRVSIVSSNDYKGVVFNFKNDRLEIIATNPNIGESKEDMIIDFKIEPIEVAFNQKYLIETLNAIDDDEIVINITDEKKPCFIEGKKDKSFLNIIMPMRI